MSSIYAQAYTEVLEILNFIPQEEFNRIPQEKIEFYKKHKDNDYIFNYDRSKTLKEQKVSREAEAIIVTLFRDFFATDTQKEKLEVILKQNHEKRQKKLMERYNPDNLFKNKQKNIIEEQTQDENVAMVEYKKESFFTRIINKIKIIFGKIIKLKL